MVKTETPKEIYVAGGGVAGCEAAIVAAAGGHHVTLFEKNDRLGGQWLLAAAPIGKSEFASFIKWQKEQLKALGVTIHLQKAVTADILQKDKPDVLVIATGSHPAIAPIKGVEQPWGVTGHDIFKRTSASGRVGRCHRRRAGRCRNGRISGLSRQQRHHTGSVVVNRQRWGSCQQFVHDE